ncbi:MAG: zinc-binding dehydrogenase [Chloroflexota bacterium]
MRSTYVCFPEPNRIEVREEEVAAPGNGEVLCQALCSLISIGTETYCLRGVFDPGTNWASWVQYPFRPGYSMAARVVAVGPGVTGVQVGDRVAASAAHQQYFRASAARVQPVPEWISDEEATWAFLARTTQLGARRAQLQMGESVAIVGLGMLGQMVTQYALLSGVRRLIAIDTVAGRLGLARAHGATDTLQMDVASARAEVERLTDGRMLDVVWDITGHPAVLAPALQLLHRFGHLVLLGDTPTPTQQHLGPGVVSNSLSILGIHGTAYPEEASAYAPWSGVEMTTLFFDYIRQERMRVADLITPRHAPADAPAVYEGLVRDRSACIGVIFDWARV